VPPAVTLVVALSVLLPTRAAALYVDPGAGSLLVQIVISAVLGATFVFHRSITGAWRSVRSAVLRLRRPLRAESRAEEEERPSHPDRRTRS
jgi:hypothetical protein